MMDFNDFAEKAVLEMVIKPMKGQQGEKATFDNLIASLSSKLDVYDKILSKQKYLAGNKLEMNSHLPVYFIFHMALCSPERRPMLWNPGRMSSDGSMTSRGLRGRPLKVV